MHLQTLYVSVFSLIILCIILGRVYDQNEKYLPQHKLYIELLISIMIVLIIDMLSWVFDGKPGLYSYLLNNLFNLLLFVADPVVAALWLLYVHFQIFHDDWDLTKPQYAITVVLLLNTALAIVSLKTGWLFTIDENNIYYRGPYVWLHAVLGFSLVIYAWIITIWNRDEIEKGTFYALLVFPLPQVVGGAAQAACYGLSLMWSGAALSMLILYLWIQDKGLSSDYLTGVYNRRQLDLYLKQKIKASKKGKSFSAILIDIDKFKDINDIYGHHAGDEALQLMVNILKKSIRNNDFIARYGGDEFVTVLDIGDKQALQALVDRINGNINEFNQGRVEQYKIDVSLGYDVFDASRGQGHQEFLRHLDNLMYNNKKETEAQAPI